MELNYVWKALYFVPRILLDGGRFIATHKSRYFKRSDGLALGPGPFVAALEYASERQPLVIGKPEAAFYQSVLDDMGCLAKETVMIGDVS